MNSEFTLKNEASAVTAFRDTIRVKGVPVAIDALRVDGQTFLVRGKFLKIAELKYFWEEDVQDPERVIQEIAKTSVRVDILKFWQRIPENEAKYSYYHEWRYPAAIPISTHERWFQKQIKKTVRTKIRKARNNGVEVRQEELSDELIRGIMRIYNDSPIRRGKPFWHYGKDFDTVKDELADGPEKSTFITAYKDGELIAFVKLLFLDRYAKTTLILDKLSRRDIAGSMNILISKIVEICEERKIPYFVYSYWRRGDHGQFQESNGFLKNEVPEYFVPLTLKGRVALLLSLHHGIKGWIPERLMIPLLDLRAKWYARKHRAKAFRFVKQ